MKNTNVTSINQNQKLSGVAGLEQEVKNLYLKEAMEASQKFFLNFETFIVLFNKANDTQWYSTEALSEKSIVDLYNQTISLLMKPLDFTPITGKKASKKVSTKRMSLEKLRKGKVDVTAKEAIYSLLKMSDKPLSRYEIAQSLGLRLSTVCGQMNCLILSGRTKVVGTKIDVLSDRVVETITCS